MTAPAASATSRGDERVVACSRRTNGTVLGSIIAAIIAFQTGKKPAPVIPAILTSTLGL
jgi:hypothetical protein